MIPYRNPGKKGKRPKRFNNWLQLRYDILFNGVTVKQAALKWGISTAAISSHLKKHPRIKKAYYERPWAQRQMKIQWTAQACRETQEVIDDIYSDDPDKLFLPGTDIYNKSIRHKRECERCQNYEEDMILEIELPYRFDCLPIGLFIAAWRGRGGLDDEFITYHLVKCRRCKLEFDFIGEEGSKGLPSRTGIYYPPQGWRGYLTITDIDTIKQVHQGNMSKRIARRIGRLRDYYNWLNWRNTLLLQEH